MFFNVLEKHVRTLRSTKSNCSANAYPSSSTSTDFIRKGHDWDCFTCYRKILVFMLAVIMMIIRRAYDVTAPAKGHVGMIICRSGIAF